MSAFDKVAIAVVILVAIWLCAFGGTSLLLSTKQRWLSECGETYSEVDCSDRWEREHPMPENYGREP